MLKGLPRSRLPSSSPFPRSSLFPPEFAFETPVASLVSLPGSWDCGQPRSPEPGSDCPQRRTAGSPPGLFWCLVALGWSLGLAHAPPLSCVLSRCFCFHRLKDGCGRMGVEIAPLCKHRTKAGARTVLLPVAEAVGEGCLLAQRAQVHLLAGMASVPTALAAGLGVRGVHLTPWCVAYGSVLGSSDLTLQATPAPWKERWDLVFHPQWFFPFS